MSQLFIYDKILKYKGSHSLPSADEALRMDLSNEKAIWTNSICADYCQYIKNNHLLISIFAVSSLHPFSRAERIYALVDEAAFTFIMFVVLEWLPISRFFDDVAHLDVIVMFGEAVFSSLFSYIMYKLGMCMSMKILKNVLYFMITFICFLGTIGAIFLFYLEHGKTTAINLKQWMGTLALSWVFDLLFNGVMFIWDSFWERRQVETGESDLIITFLDYTKWRCRLMQKYENRFIVHRVPGIAELLALDDGETDLEIGERRSTSRVKVSYREGLKERFLGSSNDSNSYRLTRQHRKSRGARRKLVRVYFR